VSVNLPNGTGTSTYLYEGNTVTVTDPGGKWRKYESDAFGNVTKTIEPNPAGGANFETTFSYNMVGKRTQLQMTRGAVTQTRSWTYNYGVQLASETHPESGTTTYGYNSAGLPLNKGLANGTAITYGYDSFGRLTLLSDSGNDCSTKEFTYGTSANNYGRLIRVTWGHYGYCSLGIVFEENYGYSASGSVTSKSVKATPPGTTVNLTYGYNNEG
jgi:YD repeat-containing protein